MSVQRSGSRSLATALRRRFERARELDPEAQVRELVDYLENPEVLVAEFVDAYCAVEGAADPEALVLVGPSTAGPRDWFAPGRNLRLTGADAPAPRCLSGPVPLLADSADARAALGPPERWSSGGLDYVALAPGPEPSPVLGVLDRDPGATPYTLLMRGLACLTELAPPSHLERVNRELFKGALGGEPRFELHLVTRRAPASDADRTLAQLTRDLAESFQLSLADEWQFPQLLRRIACLRAGRAALDVEWIV